MNNPINPVLARPALLISDQVLRHLSILDAYLDISAQAATSQATTEFIPAIIAIKLRHLEVHPGHVHEAPHIFRTSN
jgi:hypothetical protein